ncbi:hypothetical protein QJS66_01580 [Kocuria rhizophila]|nr:hypothetical protein QJS66_01580 [Kocuria rhizophila]
MSSDLSQTRRQLSRRSLLGSGLAVASRRGSRAPPIPADGGRTRHRVPRRPPRHGIP